MPSQEQLTAALDALSEQMQAAMTEYKNQREEFWSSLTKDQQIMAFCCVAERIARGELDENRSYRGMLYSVFGFGPEAYAVAQDAGYLRLHNCIYPEDYDQRLLRAFCEKLNIDAADDVISAFFDQKYRGAP